MGIGDADAPSAGTFNPEPAPRTIPRSTFNAVCANIDSGCRHSLKAYPDASVPEEEQWEPL